MSLRESITESITRKINPGVYARMDEVAATVENLQHNLAESIGAIEQVIREDPGWFRLSAEYDTVFTRAFLNECIKVSRLYFLKNPIIRRGVLLQSYYVFGRGVEIRIEGDETKNAELQDFLYLNRKRLGTTGLTETEQGIQTDGNEFWVAFRAPDGTVKVRTIDTLEIVDIATNPQDAEEPWYYKRTWVEVTRSVDGVATTETKTAWYRAMGYKSEAALAKYGADAIVDNAVVYHRKVGAPARSLFGYPEVFAALDWASTYKRFLESWATVQEAASRIVTKITTPGGQTAVDAVKAKLQTTRTNTQRETNPPPQTGSTFVGSPGQKFDVVSSRNISTSPDEARRALLMAIMLFGPETFFGDASVGSVATATSLDRPTELKFLHAQARWSEDLQEICGYALQSKAGNEIKDTKPVQILVSFPPILEHDIGVAVGAIVSAATLNGFSPAGTIDQRTLSAMLLHVLGLKDVSATVELMYPEQGYDPEDWAAATPEERQQMAADIGNRAGSVADQQKQQGNESAHAAMLSANVHKLIAALENFKGAK